MASYKGSENKFELIIPDVLLRGIEASKKGVDVEFSGRIVCGRIQITYLSMDVDLIDVTGLDDDVRQYMSVDQYSSTVKEETGDPWYEKTDEEVDIWDFDYDDDWE